MRHSRHSHLFGSDGSVFQLPSCFSNSIALVTTTGHRRGRRKRLYVHYYFAPALSSPSPITRMARNLHRWKIIKRGRRGNLRARGTPFQLASSYLYEISSGLIESVLVGKTQQLGMNKNKVNVCSSRKVFLIDIQQPEQLEQQERPRQAFVFIHSTIQAEQSNQSIWLKWFQPDENQNTVFPFC